MISHMGISSKLPFHFLYVLFVTLAVAGNAEVETKMKQCEIKVQQKAKKRKMIKVAPLGDHELVVCEILSRLPAKSLMRFKCVCKSWQSLIQRDPHFIDLHFSRSQTRSCNGTVGATSLLVRVPSLWYPHKGNGRCLLSAELLIPSESGNGGGAAVQSKIPNITTRVRMLNIVNGLICLTEPCSHSVSIFNPSIGESTPWIKSIVMQKQEEKCGLLKNDKLVFFTGSRETFGYDLATKDYKVVTLWTNKMDHVCEIFSLRHKSWRLIDAVPPVSPIHLHYTNTVYANGCIYWLRDDGKPLIVELNLVTEKFRVISVPDSVAIANYGRYWIEVMEMGGRLALLVKEGEHDQDDAAPAKMYILYDDQDETKNSTTDYLWMLETFAVSPYFDLRLLQRYSIIPIPGTDLLIVRAHDNFSFHYYDWKKKTYSRKFKLNGTKSFFDKKSNNGEHDYVGLYTFTENLLPLN